jgi:hypothetical protein
MFSFFTSKARNGPKILSAFREASETLIVFREESKFAAKIALRLVMRVTNGSDVCSLLAAACGPNVKQRSQTFLRRIGEPFAPCGFQGC